MSLQETLQNEFFSRWDENCSVREYKGFDVTKMDELLHKISDNFVINGTNLYNKLSIIEFCKDKAMQEFTKRNLVTEINTVSSLADVSNV